MATSTESTADEQVDGPTPDPATWAPWTTVSTLTGIVPVNVARMTFDEAQPVLQAGNGDGQRDVS
jgi:hypothetical protein